MSDETSPKPFVFVLMPFHKEFKDIYEVGIKQACKDAGAYCERVDEQIFDESILERIYNQIAKADIIVADMTGRNPNVFYETGYTHAIGKRVILLTQNTDDIPFDLKQYLHVVYGKSITHLKSELEIRIAWYINNPKDKIERIAFNLQPYVGAMPLSDVSSLTLLVTHQQQAPGNYVFHLEQPNLPISIHNPTKRLYESRTKIGVVMPMGFPFVPPSSFQLPGYEHLHIVGEVTQVFPEGWENFDCRLDDTYIEDFALPKKVFSLVVRFFTEIGTKDFPFDIELQFDQR